MTKEDIAKSESDHGFESKSNLDQQDTEATSPLVEKLYGIITCLTKQLTKSKEWVRSLFKEIKHHKGEIDLILSTNHVQEGTLT